MDSAMIAGKVVVAILTDIDDLMAVYSLFTPMMFEGGKWGKWGMTIPSHQAAHKSQPAVISNHKWATDNYKIIHSPF